MLLAHFFELQCCLQYFGGIQIWCVKLVIIVKFFNYDIIDIDILIYI